MEAAGNPGTLNMVLASSTVPASGPGSSDAQPEGPDEAPIAVGFSCPDEVAKRVAQLYGDERLADVTFVVRNGDSADPRRFAGHRNIISSWSIPLDRMLCGGFAEGSSREVYIQDVEPSAFEVMLKLMYCGTAEITVDNVLSILDVSVRFDVAPLVQFSVQFLQNHTVSEHACRMLEVGVQYGLVKLMDKCIELIVTDDHILESEDFNRLSQAAVIELAKHDSWNMHEDEIYDTMIRWGSANSSTEDEHRRIVDPILDHLRYPHMSVEKLKTLTTSNEVPSQLIFDALFFKLHHSGPDDPSQMTGRYKPRTGSLLFSWVSTSKVTVSGDYRENARHTSSNGFTGVRGDRRMQHGIYSWTIDIAETQSSWIFVGVAQADDPNDVAWRSTGHMLYCLDSRYFHQGSGQNHPCGDRKISSGDCIRVVLDCTRQTIAFGINNEKPLVLFRDIAPAAYVPAVDLRDCGDKVRILSSNPHVRASSGSWSSRSSAQQAISSGPQGPHRSATAGATAGAGSLVDSLPSMMQHPALGRDPSGDRRLTVPLDLLSSMSQQPPEVLGNEPGPHAMAFRGAHVSDPLAPLGARRATVGVVDPHVSHPGVSHVGHAAHATHSAHPQHVVHGATSSSIANTSHSHTAGSSGSSTRTLQPRQSQGTQGGAPMAAATQDRTLNMPSVEPLSLLEEDRESTWDQQVLDLRGDAAPPASG